MIYQLIHHNNVDQYEMVEQSPDIQTEEEKISWQNNAMFRRELPGGRTWSVVDESHAWFSKPSDLKKDEPKDDDTIPEANRNPDKPLSFDEVVAVSQERTLQERREQFEAQGRLNKHLENFEG